MGAGRLPRGQILEKKEGASGAKGTQPPPAHSARGVNWVPPPHPSWRELGGLGQAGGPKGPEASGVFPCRVGGGFHHVASPFFFFFPLHFFSSRFYLEAAPGRPRRNVTHQPARRGFGQREGAAPRRQPPSAPRALLLGLPELLCDLCAPSGRPPRPGLRTTSGVGCKESLRLPPPAACPSASRPRRLTARARPLARPCQGPRPARSPPP